MVARRERPFDLVIDTVTSHDERDASCAYERRVRGARGVLAEAGVGKNKKNKKNEPGDYVTIGGGTAEWLKAGVKRVSGIDLFAKGRELFWIRFPGCGKDLEALRALAEEKRIKPRVAQTFPLTSRGARDAFAVARVPNPRVVCGSEGGAFPRGARRPRRGSSVSHDRWMESPT